MSLTTRAITITRPEWTKVPPAVTMQWYWVRAFGTGSPMPVYVGEYFTVNGWGHIQNDMAGWLWWSEPITEPPEDLFPPGTVITASECGAEDRTTSHPLDWRCSRCERKGHGYKDTVQLKMRDAQTLCPECVVAFVEFMRGAVDG